MEELYPGKGPGGGFQINGVAKVLPATNPTFRQETGRQLIAGFYLSGRRNFFVHHQTSAGKTGNPSFSLRPLTTEFLANVVENDSTFKFSLISERIGDVTYVSGAAARDYGGEVQQGIISLDASGGWSVTGLRLSLSGELGDRSAFLGKPTPSEFKHTSYLLELDIPWAVLRFLFYDQMGFVISNHQKFCATA
jgi:hypothetical protein